ncbi:unnamed protein product [Leuciscus chuanchicus]
MRLLELHVGNHQVLPSTNLLLLPSDRKPLVVEKPLSGTASLLGRSPAKRFPVASDEYPFSIIAKRANRCFHSAKRRCFKCRFPSAIPAGFPCTCLIDTHSALPASVLSTPSQHSLKVAVYTATACLWQSSDQGSLSLRQRVNPNHLPSSAPREPRRKKRRDQRIPERGDFDECTPGPSPRASPTPPSPVLFARSDQRPSREAAGLVSFGGSAEDMDDAVSVAASESEDWSGSADPAPSSQCDRLDTRASVDAELFRVMSRAVDELGLNWLSPAEPPRSRLDEWYLPGRQQAPRQRAAPFLPEVHEELTKSWHAPFSARTRSSSSSTLSTVDGAEEKGYVSLPPLEEAVAAHLCPPTAGSWRSKTVHPSKPCRTTSAIAYAAAGQVASALHAMATLQVFQAKLLRSMDESGPEPDAFKDLRSATDLALRATKTTAQALGRNMASLVVLERHLWLNLTEIRDADKTAFLDSPVSTTGLFGPSVNGFAERFTEAQKASSAMKHFLPKRSSSASRRPKSMPRPEKSVPQVHQPRPAAETSQHLKPAKRYPFPKRQGPRPKLTLDHEPKKPS